MTPRRSPRPLRWLGGLLVLYLAYPVGAFTVRAVTGHDEGWSTQGLWPALRVSVEGATVSLAIGVLTGVPLAYVLARHRGRLSSVVSVVVQLPLAVPPLISGILLVYIVGPYTFLGQLSGERLTQTFYGVVIAQSFVSAPFLVVVARSAFQAVDPSLRDVAATLGHGPVARFLRVEVPAAGDGLRAGMVLMWLRAFGEYGTTVVLAYHPYSLPVYVDNLFSSAPLSQAEAPTILAFAVAVLVIAAGRVRLPGRARRSARLPAPQPPVPSPPTPVSFDVDATVGAFTLRLTGGAPSHRLAIVGPSGSGKSVTLRILAGLHASGSAEVRFGADDVSRTAPERRHLGYVPQAFGLIPGRTVARQVTFGVDADPARAAWWVRTLGLDELLDRLPEQLSGGQRQRVSLARALAVDPRMVLLDEPFSALDAPVRDQLRRELRRLQREVNLSTVLVTHDPVEAAMLADDIVVIDDGRVLQAGRCREVYRAPASVQVGRLLGIENLFEGTAGVEELGQPTAAPGARLLWQVAPERLRIEPAAAGDAGGHGGAGGSGARDLGRGRVTDVIDLGRHVEAVVQLDAGRELRVRGPLLPDLAVGDACRVRADPDAISVWEARAPT